MDNPTHTEPGARLVAQAADASPSKRVEIPALTGMRGVAAYSVLIAHALNVAGQSWYPLANLAHFAMTLFFTLSGFVIQYNYGKSFAKDRFHSATGRFLLARFARLYPLYFVALILSVSFAHKGAFFTDGWAALSCLTLTQSWFNYIPATGGLLGASWSISTEFGFYLMFIPLAASLSRLHRVLPVLVGFCLFSLALIITLAVYYPKYEFLIAPISDPPSEVIQPWEWLFYYSPFIRVLEFFAGALAAQLVLTGELSPTKKTQAASLLAVGCVVYCAALISFNPSGYVTSSLMVSFVFAPAIVTLLIIVSCRDIALTRFLSSNKMTAAGEISYSVYLLQPLAFLAIANSFEGLHFVGAVAKATFIVLITTVLSYGVYHLFEAPMRAKIRARGPSARKKADNRDDATSRLG